MTIIASILIILAFCLFIIIRHRAAMRLEDAYKDLERANERAKESSRMKSDFIQQISHEIRTPLNILSGYTQLLSVIECNDRVRAIQIATEAADASGIRTAKHLTFDMIIAPGAEKITLKTNLQAAVRALSLVLDNARKFTAPAETRQTGKPVDHLQKAVLRITVSSSRIFFSVEDTGIGIPHKASSKNSCSWTSIIMAQVSA